MIQRGAHLGAYVVVFCGMLRYGMLWYAMVWYGMA